MHGSSRMTKQRSVNDPVRSVSRLHVFFQAATRIFYYGARIESSSCRTRSDGQNFGRRAFGRARYSSTEKLGEFGGDQRQKFRSTRGAAFHQQNGKQSKPRQQRFPCQVSQNRLQSTAADPFGFCLSR